MKEIFENVRYLFSEKCFIGHKEKTWILDHFLLFFRFLGGQFTTYGTGVISQTEGNFTTRVDHLNVVFPKVRQYSTFKGRAFREDDLI